ncbi:MAG TPA: serine hydrolase domain-containing protein [Thermomonospora sp.]|nr:serine hydrolase domain-containing protein [Thermomonospora sp.]
MAPTTTRRDFGRLLAAGGLAATAPALLTGRARASAAAIAPDGPIAPGMDAFEYAVRTFMTERGITCGALAVVRHGRLLMARGYSNGESGVTVRPTSLFRIASLSKPVTAVATMSLVQDGRLSILDTLPQRVTLTPPPGRQVAAGLDQVNVARLLRHQGGWSPNNLTGADLQIADELSAALPISRDLNISWGITRPLAYTPGTSSSYNNFGYMLLGKIIENVTGLGYETYVRQRVLAPMGIPATRMRLGSTLTRASGEVVYRDPETRTSVIDRSTLQPPFGAPRGA